MGSRNQEFFDRLTAVECRDASYHSARRPVVLDRAKGSWVWDADGNKYLDLCAGFGVLALGHNHPVIQDALRIDSTDADIPAIEHGMGDVFASTSKIEFMELIRRLLPSHLDRISLAISGGQAVELALKTALLRKPGAIISFEGSYHGLDLGVLPLTSRLDFKQPFLSWHKSELVVELPFNCSRVQLQQACDALAAKGISLSAILVEPIQGRAGVRPASKSFLDDLRQIADQQAALLVFDEVFVGLGRCGLWSFAEQVEADLICLGKTLGGSLPVSALAGRANVMDSWPKNTGEAIHTGTFFGHPLSCRTGTTLLRYLLEHDILEKVNEMGQWLSGSLNSLRQQFPSIISEVRGRGLMWGIAFRKAGLGAHLMDMLLDAGVITLPSAENGSVLSLTPALTITREECAFGIEALKTCLQTLIEEQN